MSLYYPQFEVARGNPARARLRSMAPEALQVGQIRLRVDCFALTANNATYALLGERFQYFDFFPSGASAYALVPVWGYAQVIESMHPEVAVGERLYGFLPMAAQCVITPTKLSPQRMFDGAPHRAQLPAVYQWLQRLGRDAAAAADLLRPVLQPLALTAFLLREEVAALDPQAGRPLLMSSASSKTAMATAWMFRRDHDRPRPRLLGLTSAAHLQAVRAQGLFDAVEPYDALAESPLIEAGSAPILLDFAGNAALRDTVHRRGGPDSLSLLIGLTHGLGAAAGQVDAAAAETPRSEQLFFAPSVAVECIKTWGAEAFGERSEAAWQGLRQHFEDRIALHQGIGGEAIAQAWHRVLEGELAPECAELLRFAG